MNIVMNVIARSFIKDQYDPSLAKVGVALRYKDPTKKMEEIETNKYYATLNANHPPIHENDMDTFAIASTHHNLTLRMWEAGMQIDGQTLECKGDADLEDRVTEGHFWIILDGDKIPDNEAMDLSEWRNADNQTAQRKHEFEQLKHTMNVCNEIFQQMQTKQVHWATLTHGYGWANLLMARGHGEFGTPTSPHIYENQQTTIRRLKHL